MGTIQYTRDTPATNDNPSVDQPNMKTNTNSIDTLLQVNHNSFGEDPYGYHTVITQVTQGSDPVTIGGVNQVYAKNYTPNTTVGSTDTQLFVKSGLGILSQLTGQLVGTDGYQWIGGVLVQWGKIAIPQIGTAPKSGTVTFKDRVAGAIPFPTACFIVQLTLQSTVVTSASNSAGIIGTPGATSFQWQFSGTTSSQNIFWMAIGN